MRSVVTFDRSHTGRMGNVLFGIAAVVGYAKRHNLDIYFPQIEQEYQKLLGSTCSTIRIVHTRPETSFYIKEVASYIYQTLPPPPEYQCCVVLQGYFPHYQYFEHAFDQVREILKKPPAAKPNQIGIHVRRTDALQAEFHDHTPNYFLQAWRQIVIDHGIEDPETVIVSDDREWCKKHLLKLIPRSRLSSQDNAVEDFWELAASTYKIISASTFSWWASFVSDITTKAVLIPKPWHIEGAKEPDLGLPQWIRFPVADLPRPRFTALEYAVRKTVGTVLDLPNETESTGVLLSLLRDTGRMLISIVLNAGLYAKLYMLYPPSPLHKYMFIKSDRIEETIMKYPLDGISVVNIQTSSWFIRFWAMIHFRKTADYVLVADIDYFVKNDIFGKNYDFGSYFPFYQVFETPEDDVVQSLLLGSAKHDLGR